MGSSVSRLKRSKIQDISPPPPKLTAEAALQQRISLNKETLDRYLQEIGHPAYLRARGTDESRRRRSSRISSLKISHASAQRNHQRETVTRLHPRASGCRYSRLGAITRCPVDGCAGIHGTNSLLRPLPSLQAPSQPLTRLRSPLMISAPEHEHRHQSLRRERNSYMRREQPHHRHCEQQLPAYWQRQEEKLENARLERAYIARHRAESLRQLESKDKATRVDITTDVTDPRAVSARGRGPHSRVPDVILRRIERHYRVAGRGAGEWI